MRGYVIAGSFAAGFSVVAILIYLAFRIFAKKSSQGAGDAETKVLFPPNIVLSSSSPEPSKKRLYAPTRDRRASKENEDKMAKSKKKEKRKEVRSLWLPKKKESLPMLTATMVQPTITEHCKEQGGRGRLTFTLHYHYRYASKTSVLLVKLDNAQNLPTKDEEVFPAVYVKTQLVPSRRRVFISKVHRETANPVFDEAYEFDIEYQELQQQTLMFTILDFDCMSRYKSIGEVTVHLADLGTHGFNILREISLCVYISEPRME